MARKTRRGNVSMLKSWVAFVKRVQKEEGISYRDAMKRAKARKREWKRGGDPETETVSTTEFSPSARLDEYDEEESSTTTTPMSGGKRRRRKSRRTRRHR